MSTTPPGRYAIEPHFICDSGGIDLSLACRCGRGDVCPERRLQAPGFVSNGRPPA